MTASKTDLIEHVAATSGYTKAGATLTVDTTLSALADVVRDRGKLVIRGFGTFEVVERPARTMRNPQTGGTIDVPAKQVVKFKAAKGFLAFLGE
jgi:DNA-binding protein HU-beta